MKPSLKVITSETIETSGNCFYLANDFCLVYNIKNNIDGQSFLINWDTFIITFQNKKFAGFDAFTIKDQWVQNEHLSIPDTFQIGQLHLLNTVFHDDRYTYDFFPKFQYSSHGLLKIDLAENEKGRFYKIATDLFVKIYKKKILSFIIEKFSIE